MRRLTEESIRKQVKKKLIEEGASFRNGIVKLVTQNDFIDSKALYDFSYDGRIALFEYYDNLSDDIGEQIEFDPVAFSMEWSEYEDIEELLEDYPNIIDGIGRKEELLNEIRRYNKVIEIGNGGLLVSEN